MSALGWNKMGESVDENRMITIGWKKDSKGAGIMVTTKEAQADENYANLFEDNILQLYSGSWSKVEDFLNLPSTPSEQEEVISSFASPGSNPTGLAWDGTHLWNAGVSEGNIDKIYKLNTEGNILFSYNSPCTNPEGLAWDGSHLWVSDDEFFDNGKVYKINPDTGNLIKSFQVSVRAPAGLTWDGEHLWVVDVEASKICKLDGNGNAISSFDSPTWTPYGLTWDGEHLWVVSDMDGNIYEMDTSGNTISTFDEVSDWPAGLAWDGKYLWSADSENKIYKIDSSLLKKE